MRTIDKFDANSGVYWLLLAEKRDGDVVVKVRRRRRMFPANSRTVIRGFSELSQLLEAAVLDFGEAVRILDKLGIEVDPELLGEDNGSSFEV